MAGIPEIIQRMIIPGSGPTPAQLYEEAAPRVQVALKQYDRLAPQIDYISKNWIATLGIVVVLGVVGVVIGNGVYDFVMSKR